MTTIKVVKNKVLVIPFGYPHKAVAVVSCVNVLDKHMHEVERAHLECIVPYGHTVQGLTPGGTDVRCFWIMVGGAYTSNGKWFQL